MFLITIKLDRMSFETKGRQNLQKTADFVIESIVFCPHLQLNTGIAHLLHCILHEVLYPKGNTAGHNNWVFCVKFKLLREKSEVLFLQASQ